MGLSMIWSYGITTVPKRLPDLFPRTLASLKAAGFDQPRLFVDGAEHRDNRWDKFQLPVTLRYPTIRTMGNWALALGELYLREPGANLYAIFQDDVIAVKNLKTYIETNPCPAKGYMNLYTFPSNQALAPLDSAGRVRLGTWFESRELQSGREYHGKKQQTGRGAVGLVFYRDAVLDLLTSRHFVERPMDAHRGWRAIDGGIVESLNKAGWREWVHSPSLLQHIGMVSSMGNRPHPHAETFPGEDCDALNFLGIAP